MYLLTTTQKKLWNLSYKNYVPLVLFHSKICLIMNQFTFIIQNQKYKSYKSGSILFLFPIFAMATTVLHLALCLNWFRIQWFNRSGSIDNWKFIFMTYCVILFASIAFGIYHIIRVQRECMIMLNSSILIEYKAQRSTGN